jgi:hypothetical protein
VAFSTPKDHEFSRLWYYPPYLEVYSSSYAPTSNHHQPGTHKNPAIKWSPKPRLGRARHAHRTPRTNMTWKLNIHVDNKDRRAASDSRAGVPATSWSRQRAILSLTDRATSNCCVSTSESAVSYILLTRRDAVVISVLDPFVLDLSLKASA